MAARLPEHPLQRVDFRRGHANVYGALSNSQQVRAGVPQKLFEAIAQIVIARFCDGWCRVVCPSSSHRSSRCTVDRRKPYRRGRRPEASRRASICDGVTAQQSVLARGSRYRPETVTGALRSLRHRVNRRCCRRGSSSGVAKQIFRSLSSVKPTTSRLKPYPPSSAAISTRSNLLIPPSIECQPVVGQHQRTALGFGEVIKDDDRNFGHAQFASSQQARVAGDNDSIGTGKNRICPPKLGDRCRDLGDLFRTMRPGIPGVRNEFLDRPRRLPAGSSCGFG